MCTCTDCIGSPQSMILLIFTYIPSTYIYTPTFHVYLFKPTYPSRYIYIYNLIYFISVYIYKGLYIYITFYHYTGLYVYQNCILASAQTTKLQTPYVYICIYIHTYIQKPSITPTSHTHIHFLLYVCIYIYTHDIYRQSDKDKQADIYI